MEIVAYPAITEFKRLSSKRTFSRRLYKLEEAERVIQDSFAKGNTKLAKLNELKAQALTNEKAREELTEYIFRTLVDYGVEVEGTESLPEASELLFAEMYGFSIFQKYMDDPEWNECYWNAPDDCRAIKGLERHPLPIQFRDEKHAEKLLKRLTEDSRDGKAANDNRLNSTVLTDGTRFRWSMAPLSPHITVNMRKHSEQDMRNITVEKYIQDNIFTRPVIALLAGMAVMGICYAILGPGGVGKTALLRVILKFVHETISPRFLISQNEAELRLREYLKLLGCENVDVMELQKGTGEREGLRYIFANLMQAKGEYIIQPEVLFAEEVDNILMARRRGHIMGPFTFHSYPFKLHHALTDLYLQSYQADRQSILSMISDDVLASCHYDIIYGPNQQKHRKMLGVYEYIEGKGKPIIDYNKATGNFEVYKIENRELHKTLSDLQYVSPELFEEVKQFL